MLVVTRRPGEGITLWLPDGRDIQISVELCNQKSARIGIDAPLDVQILRNELFSRLNTGDELLAATARPDLLDDLYPKHRLTKAMGDWMDQNGISRDYRIRRNLLRVAVLADDGVSLEHIKMHSSVRRLTSIRQHIDDFYAKWRSAGNPRKAKR